MTATTGSDHGTGSETGTTSRFGQTSSGDGPDGTSDEPAPVFDVGQGSQDLGGEPLPPPIPPTCADAEQGTSTVGCRFFAVDLDQNGSGGSINEQEQYAVAVSNPQLAGQAHVVVEIRNDAGWQIVADTTIETMQMHVFNLPDRHTDGSGIHHRGAYRVSADVPVIAYQFNPLIAGADSSDASMLYPVTSWDTLYRPPQWAEGYGSPYVSIVAAVDGTTIEVTPSVATDGDAGVPAGSPGVPFQIVLNEGDVAEVASAQGDSSLAGSRIVSLDPAKPIGVFSGHECAMIPDDSAACDHIEEQISGVRLWGTDFVAARMPVRNDHDVPETSVWQVVASENDTTITFSAHPEVTGLPPGPVTLQAGQSLQGYIGGTFAHPGDFRLHATHPIALINLMTGWGNVNTPVPPGPWQPNLGDPALVQLSPVEQYLPRYVVLVPTAWERDVFVITRPRGRGVTVDGVAVPAGEFIPVDDDYEVARVLTSDGVHVLEGDVSFMVTVVGYDSADSYAYLGGSGTAIVNPTPEG